VDKTQQNLATRTDIEKDYEKGKNWLWQEKRLKWGEREKVGREQASLREHGLKRCLGGRGP